MGCTTTSTTPLDRLNQPYAEVSQLINFLVAPEHREELRYAFLYWEEVAARTLHEAIDDAFHLGWQFAQNPTSLLFKEVDDEDEKTNRD